jgi:hypothetical protein
MCPRNDSRLRVTDDTATGNGRAETINLYDDTTRATVRAHRTASELGHNDGGVSDAATAGLNDADRLVRHGRDCPSALSAVGQKLFGEFGMDMNCDLRHDALLE